MVNFPLPGNYFRYALQALVTVNMPQFFEYKGLNKLPQT